jgi:hypothetical protein
MVNCYFCNIEFINDGYNYSVIYTEEEEIQCELCNLCIHKLSNYTFMPNDYNGDNTNYFILNTNIIKKYKSSYNT